MLFSSVGIVLSLCYPVFAATAEQWRGRSIYQLITDRFALPSGADGNCDPAKQMRCGGTWNAIRENLDYIQNAGFTAIWISPVSQTIEDTTAYGQAYHGYWSADVSQLNEHFGTADDLKALSAELHRRGMYLMADVVVNNVAATSLNPDYSKYMFKDSSLYHTYCPVSWGNTTSEQTCWLGDDKVPLPDVDTTNPTVKSQYQSWIQNLVQEYSIDGLRIDAAKHVNMDFWPDFCAKAGVFCIGEVFSGIEIDPVAAYQGPQALDSVLHFPMREALFEAFSLPGTHNMSALQSTIDLSRQKFKDTSILGTFLENHDLPRWKANSVDVQTLFNAMAFQFMFDGIPIVYYGQEQGFSGSADPMNREPLWPSQYSKTPTYSTIATLNQLRNYLVNQTDWATKQAQIVTTNSNGLAMIKGDVITIVTNIGSPPQNDTNIVMQSPYDPGSALVDVFTCQQWEVSSKGMLEVEYTKGGKAVVLVPSDLLQKTKMCGDSIDKVNKESQANSLSNSSVSWRLSSISVHSLLFIASSLLYWLW